MEQFKVLIDEMKIRGFSRKTIDSYLYINQRFLDFAKKSPREVTKKDIGEYLVRLYDQNKASATRHLIVCALKFYYEELLKRRFQLKYPKVHNKLPIVLSKEDILKMIQVTNNLKHKLLLELLYGSGLRVGEGVKIRIEDIDIKNKLCFIRNGKGGKDRIVRLSDMFIVDFSIYLQQLNNKHTNNTNTNNTNINNTNNNYLFESQQKKEMHISIRTAQKIVEQSLAKANITKNAHPHTLRTSFATHLVQNKVDISYLQKILGHSRLETTQRYIRLNTADLIKIKSPLD